MLHPTPTPQPAPSLPPIGFNHRYGNSPVSAADGLEFERSLYAAQAFWEVGLRADPQLAGFVDRTEPAAVTQARHDTTTLVVSLATERLGTIEGMLAMPDNTAQEQYCIAVLQHFRTLGYSNLTKANVIVFFTEADEHAILEWTPSSGYKYTVNDNNLKGNALTIPPSTTPLPAPSS